jgi:putative hydrolase, CocE/NonD family
MSEKTYQASEPKYKMIVEENVMVTARDGVKLAVDIYRPDAPGEFPGLFTISVYGKATQTFETPPQPFGGSIFEASIESGNPEYFVSRGYVFVIADFRGIGDSEGEMPGMFSKYEAEDGYDVVEWMAEQPWCNGNIGGVGICYFGFTQLMIAELQPPHLKCIAPWEINNDDFYKRGLYPGGVLHLVWYGLYVGCHPARVGNAAKNFVPAMTRELSPEELKKRVEEACQDPDLKQYPYLYQVLKYPYKSPIIFDALLNPLDGPFWQERSYSNKLDKVNIPTYVAGPFHGPFGECAMAVYNKLVNVPFKKLNLYNQMDPRPWRNRHDELLRWYDYWLKGMDTGIVDEIPCKIEISGKGTNILTDAWPPKKTEWQKYYLAQHGDLLPEPDLYNDEPDSYLQRPFYVSEERGKLSYITPPLAEDLQVAGPPRIKFYASLDQKDSIWRVEVREADSDAVFPLSAGWLRASLRKRQTEKDTEWEIFHDFTQFDYPVPGEIYEYEIQLRPMCHLFKAGKQIKFEISSVDVPLDASSYDEMWRLCKAQTCLHKVYRDADHQSVLSLPTLQD